MLRVQHASATVLQRSRVSFCAFSRHLRLQAQHSSATYLQHGRMSFRVFCRELKPPCGNRRAPPSTRQGHHYPPAPCSASGSAHLGWTTRRAVSFVQGPRLASRARSIPPASPDAPPPQMDHHQSTPSSVGSVRSSQIVLSCVYWSCAWMELSRPPKPDCL